MRNKFFSVGMIIILMLFIIACGGGGGGDTPPAPITYNISGTVSGAVVNGVTITLTGAATASITTDSSGVYSFPGLANGSYTVTPSLTGYTFTPTSTAETVSGANITGTNFVATAVSIAFTQADLTGTWHLYALNTSDSDNASWWRAIFTVDSSGNVTFLSGLHSDGDTTIPAPGTVTMTINSSGVITITGSGNTGDHWTMASNKKFIAGTTTSGGGGSDKNTISILQKEVPGTTYSSADVQNKSLVYHHLMVGTDKKWIYGAETTNATGTITNTSETTPSGTTSYGPTGVTLSVNSSGIVTMDGDMAAFQGFLSADKKTIVGTWRAADSYHLMIIQVTGQTYAAGLLPAGTWVSHMLATGVGVAFWARFTDTCTGSGVITFSDWVDSNGGSAPAGSHTGSISSSGTVTVAESPSFHGQASDDGKFMVATQTVTTGAYSLQVNTH
jgi:hypothetical protein